MRWVLVLSAILGALSIVAGAVREHIIGLSEAMEAYEILHTGIRYHQLHSVVLLILGLYSLSQGHSRCLAVSAALFAAGILLFSGSLYATILLNMPALAFLTPLGGICFIAGWFSLAFIQRHPKLEN